MKKSLMIIIIAIILFLNNIKVFANNEKLIVELVIDTSGSMLSTDPGMLRQEAANVFIDLLSPEDYLGIITFNSKVDTIIPIQQLTDSNIKDSIRNQLEIGIRGTGNTDYKQALDKAYHELSKVYTPNGRKVIVFLTDGEPDPDDIGNNPELMDNYMNEFWSDTITNLSKSNLPVYSIGFSDGIDVEVLERIAEETKGDVRIFKDAEDLDKNLIQQLKTRDIITTQLLAPTYESNMPIRPSIYSDFWMKSEGFRNGEEVIVSAALNLGSIRLQGRSDLTIDSFYLEMNYEDGTRETFFLYDDGDLSHGDLKADDGIFSNKIVFDRNGRGNASIIVGGKFKDEELSLNKPIGEFFVDNPGEITVSSIEQNLWARKKENIIIPLSFVNNTKFKEVVFIDTDFNSNIVRVELEPEEKKNIDLEVNHDGLDKGAHMLNVSFRPLNGFTTIENQSLVFSIEIVSFFQALQRIFNERSLLFIPLIGIFVVLPLTVYILGLLLYLILVKPQTRVKGILTYWEEVDPSNKVEVDLKTFKKNKVIITFDPNKKADYYIKGSNYSYSIEMSKEFLNKKKSFILGWMVLLTKKPNIVLKFKCTKPGIIIYDYDIYTNLIVTKDIVFSSGGFVFDFISHKSIWNKESAEGKNILEGRI